MNLNQQQRIKKKSGTDISLLAALFGNKKNRQKKTKNRGKKKQTGD